MEKRPITLALGKIAFAELTAAFKLGRWMSWDFPDCTIRLELDPTITDAGVIHRHDGRRYETQRLMDYQFPQSYLPDDITRLLNISYSEAIRCYEGACFLATVALCGRTIETALASLYEKVVGVHPSADTGKPGMNAIINRLRKEGFSFPTGLKEKMEIIAIHRNMAIHANLVIPSEDEVRSVIYLTRDVLRMMVK